MNHIENKEMSIGVIKKDEKNNLSVVPKKFSKEFFVVDGDLYFIINDSSEDEEPVVLSPYAYYSDDGKDRIEGWSMCDEGKYYWVSGVSELYDSQPSDGLGILVLMSQTNEKDHVSKAMISCVNEDGEADFSEGMWISSHDMCLDAGIDIGEMKGLGEDQMYENPKTYRFCISEGIYIIDDYVFKYDGLGLLYRNINESEYKNTGMELKEYSSCYDFYFYDNNLYYLLNGEIRKVDLEANKNIKLCDIPDVEKEDASIVNIYGDYIFIDTLVNDYVYKNNTYVYNLKTNTMEKNIPAELITVEDDYILVKNSNGGGTSVPLYSASFSTSEPSKLHLYNVVLLLS